jgi:hypothetical protein
MGKKDESEVVDQGEDIDAGERVTGGLRRRRHQPSKLSDGDSGVNSGEKFRQPSGTKIRVSEGQNTEEIVRYL